MFDSSAPAVDEALGAIEAHPDSGASNPSLARRAAGEAAASGSPEVPLPVLEARITELAGHLNAAGHRFLVLLAEFDRREGWADGATRSCAHWLSWKCGIDRGAAREKVRVARALETLPGVGAAMGRGELSYSKVRAITRVATPETEASLLMIALHGTVDHIESVVRGFRRAQQAAELSREAVQHAGRTLRWHHDEDGSLVMQVRLPTEGGALVLKALQAAVEADGRSPGVSAETPVDRSSDTSDTSDSAAQRRADALVRLAECWLSDGERALVGADRQQLVVHVDVATLVAGEAGRSALEGGPVLAAETVRRLGCDASLVAIVEDGEGRVLDVGRRTRSIPSAIGRALRARDGGCRFPGCTHTRQLDGHHVTHWAHGGATRLSNLVLLCRRHHRRVHEGGARVRLRDDGAAEFTDALGRRIEAAPPTAGSPDWVVATHRREGPPIDPHTAVGHWRGERLDLGLAVAGLCAEGRVGEPARPSGTAQSGSPTRACS
ncbi:MAG: HNH endonuclease [Burkholderiales bacterium]|nr:MAG: HNH endonuclease [Burkholderiales bacterium]